jgi:hypothetical protein
MYLTHVRLVGIKRKNYPSQSCMKLSLHFLDSPALTSILVHRNQAIRKFLLVLLMIHPTSASHGHNVNLLTHKNSVDR